MNPPLPATRPANYFRWIVLLVSSILAVAGVGGLGIVYLRGRISASAYHLREMETETVALERKLQHLQTRIASAQNPEYLRRRAASLGLTLAPPKADRVVRLLPSGAARRMAARAPEAPEEPLLRSFDLALMEPLARPTP